MSVCCPVIHLQLLTYLHLLGETYVSLLFFHRCSCSLLLSQDCYCCLNWKMWIIPAMGNVCLIFLGETLHYCYETLKIFTSGAWTLKWKVTSENRHTSEHFWTESECAWPAMPERPLPQSQHHWVSFPELCSCVTPTKMCVHVFDLMRQWRTLFLHSPNSFRPPAHTHLCRHR